MLRLMDVPLVRLSHLHHTDGDPLGSAPRVPSQPSRLLERTPKRRSGILVASWTSLGVAALRRRRHRRSIRHLHARRVTASPTLEKTDQSVGRLFIDASDMDGFHESWSQAFRDERGVTWHPDVSLDKTHEVVVESYKHSVKWLPQDVLTELLRFTYDKDAPAALWISGFPVDTSVPPTPVLNSAEPGLSAARSDDRLPVCDTWVLGLARILGIPYRIGGFDKSNARGGLLRDMLPKPGVDGRVSDLGLHRDLPSGVSRLAFEPDAFILLAARGDTRRCVHTLVCSNKLLFACLSPAEREALRRSPVQVRFRDLETGVAENYGFPFHALEGPDDEPKITLHGFVQQPGDSEVGEVVSLDAETQAAYERAAELAKENATRVDLQEGDMLILNNARCNHGRCGYTPRGDGGDRWLVKTFVHCGGWSRPSQLGEPEPFSFPEFWPRGDK
mmetsp:Transcript_22951/g.42180  ORF Transcript_22951/g.42180 Transcript_22951/m.42180 type:complete len:446 (+) Transcript_22951:77-1414(+)